MGIGTATGAMTTEEIVALNREHTFFSWSVQGAIDPIAIDRAEGVWLYTPDGAKILDFNSQLMSVNIGHGDRRVIDAITEQATKLQYVQPAFATEIRARLGQKLAEILPGRPGQGLLHAGRGGGDRERHQARPPPHRTHEGPRPLSRLPRRDPRRDDPDRRSASLGERAGPRRRGPLPGHAPLGRGGAAPGGGEPAGPRGRHPLRGAAHHRGASSSRRSSGPTGSSSRPTATSPGSASICDRHDILMVCDEVMAGFGRTGRWFAVDHWDVVPDLMTMAKGLTSSYLPLGAVAMRRPIAEAFDAEDVLRRSDLLVAPGVAGRRAGHDPGLRGGRPHRQRRAARHAHAGAPRAPGREAPERRGASEPGVVRHPGPRPDPRPVDADDARSTARRTR